jgi:serine/threonine protein kinase
MLGTPKKLPTSAYQTNTPFPAHSGGSVAALVHNFGPLDDSTARAFTSQMLAGLEYLHDKRIVCHPRLTNCMIADRGVVKLCDYGMLAHAGQPEWYLSRDNHGDCASLYADIKALGACVAQMLGATQRDALPAHVSVDAHAFVDLCAVAQTRRITASLLRCHLFVCGKYPVELAEADAKAFVQAYREVTTAAGGSNTNTEEESLHTPPPSENPRRRHGKACNHDAGAGRGGDPCHAYTLGAPVLYRRVHRAVDGRHVVLGDWLASMGFSTATGTRSVKPPECMDTSGMDARSTGAHADMQLSRAQHACHRGHERCVQRDVVSRRGSCCALGMVLDTLFGSCPPELVRGYLLHEELRDRGAEKSFLVFQKTYCMEQLKNSWWVFLAGVVLLCVPKFYRAYATFPDANNLVRKRIHVRRARAYRACG